MARHLASGAAGFTGSHDTPRAFAATRGRTVS